jgi:hypothetical protein
MNDNKPLKILTPIEFDRLVYKISKENLQLARENADQKSIKFYEGVMRELYHRHKRSPNK